MVFKDSSDCLPRSSYKFWQFSLSADGFIEEIDVETGWPWRTGMPTNVVATAIASAEHGAFFNPNLGDDGFAAADGTEDASTYWVDQIIAPFVVTGDMCLTYKISSGDDTSTTASSWYGTTSGWGFIHYWFTPFRR